MFALIMAGGQGTRFWPKSRKPKPKQFLDIIGKETMINKNIEKLTYIIPKENIYAIVNESSCQAYLCFFKSEFFLSHLWKYLLPLSTLFAIYGLR